MTRVSSDQAATQPAVLQPRRVCADEGQVVRVAEHLVAFKLAAAATGHAFSLIEVQTLPGGGLPLHAERFEEKTLYVLDGCYVLRIGDETAVLGAGDLAFVPRGTPYALRNASPTAARMLVLATPGGIHEGFLAEIGEPVADPATPAPAGQPDIARIAAAAPGFGITLLDSWESSERTRYQ